MSNLRRIARRCQPLGVHSVLALSLVALVGPLLTWNFGISRALLNIIPLLYANAIALLVFIFIYRKVFAIGPSAYAYLAFEFLACPVLVVNLSKRLVGRADYMPNTRQLIAADADASARIEENFKNFDLPGEAR